MLERSSPSSPFVASLSTRIERHASAYLDSVVNFLDRPPAVTEQRLLDSFATHVENVLASYEPPGLRRTGDDLIFGHLYAMAVYGSATELRSETLEPLLAALLAAEVEFRGPLRLSRTQTSQLAEIYERLGGRLASVGLPGHAALAFQRAKYLYRVDEDRRAEDRCGLALARARRRATASMVRRFGHLATDLLCGYGYRPFRLLWWIALQVLACAVAVLLVSDLAMGTVLQQVLINYLNPLGPRETADLSGPVRWLYLIESYVGALTSAVFFALLVRRWFRI
ncbi:hypothetical protein LTV02_31975 [Nocardia yamanashiensis]|uniref:hypothetical protein n=1 Tax=Nocardia yamanashiensis TaxID=209247 RepID=UPI001E2CBC33|nr:hypothetical protein [Nocardia yamanashiensis]UGT40577.1 hypothetical protein LTV02_31975 [Nocardia yamanashiensis]